ncbi:DUF1493 family protein [Pantoea ananatis]|uniref:DUF1493 family protein n=1 Tax=Pantoea ananas TaxID=553 RepID=UPI00207A8873|nr:DUF1493 family protein [Pantoea ananatis]MCW0351641.1 hypothetical protein [Pantoea ananatis]USL59481.1 DUF1493 family protein [Pantoea ananatis]
MVTDEQVLDFFRQKLPQVRTFSFKIVPLEINDTLQEYAEFDDLVEAIDKYSDQFNIDVSTLNIDNYYPWKTPWLFREWFKKEPVKQNKKPLTVRMFAESAKAGKWLYE